MESTKENFTKQLPIAIGQLETSTEYNIAVPKNRECTHKNQRKY